MDKKIEVLIPEQFIERFRAAVIPHLTEISEECVKARNVLKALEAKARESSDPKIKDLCTSAGTSIVGEIASACTLPTLNIIMSLKDLGPVEDVIDILETALDRNISHLLDMELDLHASVEIHWHHASECKGGDEDETPSPSKLH